MGRSHWLAILLAVLALAVIAAVIVRGGFPLGNALRTAAPITLVPTTAAPLPLSPDASTSSDVSATRHYDTPSAPSPIPPLPQRTVFPLTTAPRGSPTAPAVQPTPEPSATVPDDSPVLVGAGDIAVCGAEGDEATAELLDQIPGTVFTLGDNVYPRGTAEEFENCYDPSWGRHKARTRPSPGNHDYATAGAAPYYAYFGANAGEPGKGYYSYDLGAWHIVVLNSEIDAKSESPQVEWLRADLAAHPTRCTLAMWHKPLFSSGPHGRDGSGDHTRALWEVLYENGADVVLNGHDHNYERFAPQNPHGEHDAARGIRQFVVGTGGAAPYVLGELLPNSEAQRVGHFGVLKLTLHPSSYDWEFIPVTGVLFKDRGRGECH